MQITQTYGADHSGLVCGYLFKKNQPVVEISSAQANEWLDQPEAIKHDTFLWLHFNLAHVASEKWLKKYLLLPEAFYETLHEGSRTTRIELIDQSLVAVVNDVLYHFSFDASDISTLWLTANQTVLVSARSKSLLSVDRLREAVRAGEVFRSPVALLIHLLRDQEDVLVNIMRQATQRVDEIEDGLLAKKLSIKRGELGKLRRVLVRLQRLLALEPAAMFRFLHRPPEWIDEEDINEFRQSTEEFALALEDMNTLVERIKLLQEEIAAELNEQTNDSLFVLTIVTVLALPINIIAGLFGMNVAEIPLSTHPNAFWWVIGLVVTITLMMALIIKRIVGARRE